MSGCAHFDALHAAPICPHIHLFPSPSPIPHSFFAMPAAIAAVQPSMLRMLRSMFTVSSTYLTPNFSCPAWLPVSQDQEACACVYVEAFIVVMGMLVLPLYFAHRLELSSRWVGASGARDRAGLCVSCEARGGGCALQLRSCMGRGELDCFPLAEWIASIRCCAFSPCRASFLSQMARRRRQHVPTVQHTPKLLTWVVLELYIMASLLWMGVEVVLGGSNVAENQTPLRS
jgi:hypothetical protein